MRKATAMAVLTLAAAMAAGAQDRKFDKSYPQDGIWWATSWDEAVAEAQARNAPIHFTLHKDG